MLRVGENPEWKTTKRPMEDISRRVCGFNQRHASIIRGWGVHTASSKSFPGDRVGGGRGWDGGSVGKKRAPEQNTKRVAPHSSTK